MNDFNNINVPVPSKTNFVDNIKSFLSSRKRTVVATSSFLIAMVMTGSAFYLAYKTYNSRTPDKIGAANPSCYLELSLATPIPVVTSTPAACLNNPVDIVIALDRSGSIGTRSQLNKLVLTWEKEAAISFVNTISALPVPVKSNVRIGVVSWAGINANIKNLPLTNDFAAVNTFINSINYISTDDYTCIECGLLQSQALLATTPNRKAVILMSDGIANRVKESCTGTTDSTCSQGPTPPPCTRDAYLDTHCAASDTRAISTAALLRNAGIKLHVVGYGQKAPAVPDAQKSILEDNLMSIAGDNTTVGGSFYHYGGDVTNWASVFTSIAPALCKDVVSPTPISSTPSKSTATPTSGPRVTPTSTPMAVTPKPTASPSPTPVAQIPSANFIVAADSYVAKSASTTNYGTSKVLYTGGSFVYIAYLKFDLTTIKNMAITSATLNLNVTNNSVGTQVINSTLAAWSESTVNYSNKPANAAGTVASFVANSLGAKSVDITSFVNANKGKVVTLAISSVSTDVFTFNSRESATGKPTIVVK